MSSQQKTNTSNINTFLFLCFLIYFELQIVPEFFFSLESIKLIIRDSFILVSFSLVVFVFIMSEIAQLKKRSEPNRIFLFLHFIFIGFVLFFLNYLKGVDQKTVISQDHPLMVIASIFKENVKHLSVIYRIEYLGLALLCHLTLIAAFFRVKYIYIWYLLSFPLAIMMNELHPAFICPLLFYTIWLTSNLYVKRILSLAFGLCLSTLFNKQLWTMLAYSVSKINVFLLSLFFSPVVQDFSNGHNPIIGTKYFSVYIADKCSGMEGLTTFFLVFLVIFIPKKREFYNLRLLIFITFGLGIMYITNALRIFVLILIGHFYDSQFTVDLWHSYGSMFLYAGVIYLLFSYGYSWCKIPQEKLKPVEVLPKNKWLVIFHKKFESFSDKMNNWGPILMRFPVDLFLLVYHSIWINIAKTKWYQKRFKSNCQNKKMNDYGQVVVVYCKASRWYGSPKLIKCACPLLDTSKPKDSRFLPCTAQEKPPLYKFRALIIWFVFFIFLGAMAYSGFMLIQYRRNLRQQQRVERQNLAEEKLKEARKLITAENYEGAKKALLEAQQLTLRFAESYTLLGGVYEKLQKTQKDITLSKILQQYFTAVALNPEQAYAHKRIAFILSWTPENAKKAIEHAERVLEIDPTSSGEMMAILAICESSLNNEEKTREYAKEAMRLSPDLPICRYLNAIFLLEKKDYQKAALELEKIKDNPDLELQVKMKLVAIYIHLKQDDKTEKVLLNIMDNFDSLEAEAILVKHYFDTKQREKAIIWAEKHQQNIKDNVVYIENLVSLLVNNNEFDLALRIASKNIEKYNDSISLHLAMAKIFFHYYLSFEMKKHCDFVLSRSREDAPRALAYSLLADMSSYQGANKDAVQYYKKILEINASIPEVYLSIGKIYEVEEEFEVAIKIYEKALEYAKDHFLLNAARARCYIELKNWEKVKEYFFPLLRKQPNSILLNNLQGRMYQQRGDIAKAENIYRSLIKKYPQENTALNNLALLLMAENKLEEAKEYALLSVKYASNHPGSLQILGEILYKMEDWEKAYHIFYNLSQKAPQNGIYLYYYGLTLVRLNQNNKAYYVLEQSIKFLKKDSFIKHAKQIIKKLK